MLALLPLVLAMACSEQPQPATQPADRLFAVVERGLPWEPLHVSDATPLSISWDFDTADADRGPMRWEPAGNTHRQFKDGRMLLAGDGAVVIEGPTLDPEIHHVISMRLRTRLVTEVLVHWRDGDETFHESRAYRQILDSSAGEEFQTLAIPVSSLRGTRHLLPPEPGDPPGRKRWSKARDAAEGVKELRVTLRGKGAVKAELDELHIISEFDHAATGSQRLARAGIYCVGSIVRGADSLKAEITPRPVERLRMSLAVAGADSPATIRLRDSSGELAESSWTLQPDDQWLEVAIDLSPRAGKATQLELMTEGGGRHAVVLVGNVVRMAPAEEARPSIVLYLVDTLRADRLATYGYERQTDPRLQAIAEEGVVFESVMASSNWTRPATSSLLTSLDPITHGNNSHLNRVSSHVETLAERLAEHGYLTTSFVTNFNASEWAGLEQGMDIWHDPPAYGAVHAADSLTSRLIGGPIRAFLEEHKDEQVFVYAHSGDPHVPYDPPASFVAELAQGPAGPQFASMPPDVLGNATRYDAEILFNDREIGLIDDTLEATGRKQNTVFAFVSDHGEGFGEHGAFEHRRTLYEEELHVPWVLRWPESVPSAQRRQEAVSQVDLAPTLLGLVGGSIPDSWQGRDLSEALRAGAGHGIPQAPLISHVLHSAPKEGLADEIAVRWGSYKLIAGVTPDGELVPRALHNLGADPGEAVDLLDSPEAKDVQAAALSWARRRVELSRDASIPDEADAMDPAKRQWMIEMGYL